MAQSTHPDVNFNDAGSFDAATFTPTLHHEPEGLLNPENVHLTHPFVVCIVGASRGIGAGIALNYAKAGASGLVLAARRTPGLEETAKTCKNINPAVEIECVSCDLTSSDSVAALAARTKERFGRLDVAVVNAGLSGPFILRVTETDSETFQSTINVNYIGTFLCARHLIPLLLSTPNGAKSFIAVNSLASLIVRGEIAHAHYCISKAAQLRLVEHIHEQLHREDLSAFALHPGAVKSEMSSEAPASFQPFLIDSAELCGAMCVWLTKEKAGGRGWLSGRMVSSNWDVQELEARREEIVEKDLLKLKLSL